MLLKVFSHPFKYLESGVPITSMVGQLDNSILPTLWEQSVQSVPVPT